MGIRDLPTTSEFRIFYLPIAIARPSFVRCSFRPECQSIDRNRAYDISQREKEIPYLIGCIVYTIIQSIPSLLRLTELHQYYNPRPVRA